MIQTKPDVVVTEVFFDEKKVFFSLQDGRIIGAPLEWYPKLRNASANERDDYEIAPSGYGVHWPSIDEDISAVGMLDYRMVVRK